MHLRNNIHSKPALLNSKALKRAVNDYFQSSHLIINENIPVRSISTQFPAISKCINEHKKIPQSLQDPGIHHLHPLPLVCTFHNRNQNSRNSNSSQNNSLKFAKFFQKSISYVFMSYLCKLGSNRFSGTSQVC